MEYVSQARLLKELRAGELGWDWSRGDLRRYLLNRRRRWRNHRGRRVVRFVVSRFQGGKMVSRDLYYDLSRLRRKP